MDPFELFLRNAIDYHEKIKEDTLEQLARNIYIGHIAAFKACLAIYQEFKLVELRLKKQNK